MARVVKIDNAILKRIKQRQEREKRAYRLQPIRKRYLIVCEGEKTEPNYFKSYKLLLPKGIVDIDIIGEGDNTLNIVNKVIEIRNSNEGLPYDECWAVFDKDSFPNERFNNAVFLAKKEGIGCAYSNEAFELWYLLHFELYENAMSRSQYAELLTSHLKEPYLKNTTYILKKLHSLGSEDLAIERAQRLVSIFDGRNPASENPVTYVHELISSLKSHMK